VIMVGAVIGLIGSNSFIMLLLFYCVFCIGEATTFLLCFVYAAEAFDKKYIGTSMAAFDSVMDLSLFLGPLIAISAYSVTANITPIFIIAVVPAMFAFFILAFWLPGEVKK